VRIGNPVAFSHLVPWRVVKGMVINMETIVKKVSYHLQVYDILKRRILDGDLKCGEKINENALTNTHFHDVIISGCQNSHLLGMIEKNRSLSLLARNQEFSGFKRDESYLNEHMAIVEALKQRNNALVEERMRIHVMNDMKFYMEHWES